MSSPAELMNKLFETVMFQVVGSTPAGIVEALKRSGIKDKKNVGIQLATISVFAACVNKPTLQNFMAKDEFKEVRPIIANAISIAGNANMTALTLLGHCLLTTGMMDRVAFVAEFRKKIGQQHIWAGGLDAGSLSDKQKKIMQEKVRVTNQDHAKLLGSGFWKYTGIDPERFGPAEAEFWDEHSTGARETTEPPMMPANVSPPRAVQETSTYSLEPSPPRDSPAYRAGRSAVAKYVTYNVPGMGPTSIEREAADYYLAVNEGDERQMFESIKKRGATEFSKVYSTIAARDPERRGVGSSTIG